MRKSLAILMLIAAPAVTPRCWGQGTPDQLNFLGSTFEGFQFYGVSAFLNHAEYGYPQQNITTATPLLSRTNFGVSGTVGWQRLRGKFNFAARYTGSYVGDANNSDRNRPGHSAVLSATRPLGTKWNINFAGTGQILSLRQYIFDPTYLGALSQSQAGIVDLGAAMSIGQFSNAQTGMQLQTAYGGIPPTSAALLGNQLMIYNATVSLSYQPTSRLSVSIASFATGGQHLSGNSVLATNYIMPRTFGGTAGVSLRYSLTPRTDFGVSVGQSYVRSDLQQGYSTSLTGSLSRKMTAHWFLSLSAGTARANIIHQTAGVPQPLQVTYSASTGYRLRTITFVATYSQSGIDKASGLIGRNRSAQAAGNWRPLRSAWSVGASYDRNDTANTGFSSLSGWRIAGHVSRTLPWNLRLVTSYTYLSSRGIYLGLPNELTVNGLRVSVGWTPVRRRETSTQLDPIE